MKIKEYRKSLKMTQRDLAQSIGVSRSAVAMWEKEINTPRPDILKKLSELFGCTIDELVKG